VEAAHRQLGRSGSFQLHTINDALARQHNRLQRRRERLRDTLFDLLEQGFSEQEQDERALVAAAKSSQDELRAVLTAAIDQLLLDDAESQLGSDASNENWSHFTP
jgi:hypothetical protein